MRRRLLALRRLSLLQADFLKLASKTYTGNFMITTSTFARNGVRVTTAAFAALAACAGSTAFAQDVSGWYGGANIGRTNVTIDDPRITSGLAAAGFITNSISDRDSSTGYKVFGGYQINQNFAVEGGYFDLGKFGYTAYTTPTGTLSGNMRVTGLNLDLVGSLPLSEKFSAFGRVGLNHARTRDNFSGTGALGATNTNPSANGTNYKLGVGLQYALSEAWSIRGELERYRVKDGIGNLGHIDMASVGLVYRFGGKTQQPVAKAFVPVVSAPPPAPAPAPVFVAPPPPPPPPPVVAVPAAPAPVPAPQPAFEPPARPAKQGRN